MGLSTTYTKAETDFLIQQLEKKTTSGYKGDLIKTDVAPTSVGFYGLIETGIYTNLGGIDAPIGKLNFASFDGTTWSLISVDTGTSASVDETFSTTSENGLQNKLITNVLMNNDVDVVFDMPLTNVYFVPIEIQDDIFKVAGAIVDVSFLNVNSGVTIQSSLYDSKFTLISESQPSMPASTGEHYIALPYAELAKGTYYISLATNDYAGNVLKLKGKLKDAFAVNQVFPSPTAPTLIKKTKNAPEIRLVEHVDQSIATPSIYTSTGWKYMCFIAEAKTNGVIIAQKDENPIRKIGYSEDRGVTFTDLGSHYLNNINILDIFFDTTTKSLFTVSGSLGITKSNNIINVINGTETLSWTAITITAKQSNALYLTMGGCIAGGFLWVGEYSNASTGELASSPRIHKINLSTGVTTQSFALPNSRHIHAIRQDSDGKLWACVGDLNYGNGVGFWRLDMINPSGTADTWVKYSRTSYYDAGVLKEPKNSNIYPVGFSFVTIKGNKYILGAADRPKMLSSLMPIKTELTGIANINAQAYTKFDAKSGETQRGGILDYNLNFWSYSQETTEPKVWVSPPPYQQRFEVMKLYDGKELQGVIKDSPIFFVKNSADNDGYIFINNYRISAVAVSQLKTSGESFAGTIVDGVLYDSIKDAYTISQVIPAITSIYKKTDFIDRINFDMETVAVASLYLGVTFMNFVKNSNHKTVKILFEVKSVGVETPRVQLRVSTAQTSGGVSQVAYFDVGKHVYELNINSLANGTYNVYANLILKSDGTALNTANIDVLKIWVE